MTAKLHCFFGNLNYLFVKYRKYDSGTLNYKSINNQICVICISKISCKKINFNL